MYNKLFTKILDSTVWLEPDTVRIVWITFLAVCSVKPAASHNSLMDATAIDSNELKPASASFVAVAGTKVNVLALTVNAEDKPREFEQNPAARRPMLLPMSDNERTGVEFSYAFFLWVNPASFGNDEGLKHIFHKGNPTPFPLMAPGVFMKNNTNTLRVYMNSSKTWNNYIDIDTFAF